MFIETLLRTPRLAHWLCCSLFCLLLPFAVGAAELAADDPANMQKTLTQLSATLEQLRTAKQSDVQRLLIELSVLQSQLQAIDAQVRANFSQLRQRIQQQQLPPALVERHQTDPYPTLSPAHPGVAGRTRHAANGGQQWPAPTCG